MKNVYRLRDREDPTNAACEWLARVDRGLTDQEQANLREWLAGNPQRGKVLIEIAGIWDKMDSLSKLGDLFPKPQQRLMTWSRALVGAAASILLAASFMFISEFFPESAKLQSTAEQSPAPIYQGRFATAIGEHETIPLPDGTAVTLNTQSRLLVEFNDRERRLVLESGEIYVKVAHDSRRPLRVFVGDRIVQAVGTEFNVAIGDDQRVDVTVTEGKVLIAVNQSRSLRPEAAGVEPDGMQLVAGERVVLGQSEVQPELIKPDDLVVKLSWRNGNLIFRGQPLAEALEEIERYTPVEFVITDEKLKTLRVAGMFKAGDVEGLLETLNQNFAITYERVGAEKIIIKRE